MSTVDRSSAPAPAPIRPFALPRPTRTRLSNGVTVLAAQKTALPVVTTHMVIDAGALREHAHGAGLATLCANALDTGAAGRSGPDLAWAFEELGVELEAWATWDALSVRATSRSDRLEATLGLIADVVRQPTFPESEVARLRDEQLAELMQRAKEPRALANDMAARFLFGPGATYGRPLLGSLATVGALDRDAVASFQQSRFAPANTAVVITGAVEPERAADLVRANFGDWVGSGADPIPFVPGTALAGRRIHVVDRPDAVQSEIRIGHLGVARDHADYFPLVVMNTLLGGAFTSRLNLNLRERQGFTYGVRSGFAFRRRPGPFIVQTAVATDVTAPAVTEILNELEALRADGSRESEVEAACDYVAGTLPLELQTTAQIARRFAELAIFDLPDDYFEHYADNIHAVTRPEVDRVAREHVRTDDMTLVVVGNSDAVKGPLEALGFGPLEIHENSS